MSSSINKHVAFFFSLTFSHFLSAQPSIAILDFQGKGVSEIEASTLTDRLASELFNLGRFKLIEREQMNELLEEQGFQQTGCVSSECAVEVGMMVGAEQIVTGSISKIGDLFSVATRIVDVETGEILQMTNYDFEGDIGQLMTRGMRNAAAQFTTAEYFTQEVDLQLVPLEATPIRESISNDYRDVREALAPVWERWKEDFDNRSEEGKLLTYSLAVFLGYLVFFV